jgi:hypothetical protein
VFRTVATSAIVADVLEHARQEMGQAPRNAGDLVVLGRNVERNESLRRSEDGSGDEIRREDGGQGTLGVLAERVWDGNVGASVLVVKAGH